MNEPDREVLFELILWAIIIAIVIFCLCSYVRGTDLTNAQKAYMAEFQRIYLKNGNLQQFALDRPNEGKAGCYALRSRKDTHYATLIQKAAQYGQQWLGQ